MANGGKKWLSEKAKAEAVDKRYVYGTGKPEAAQLSGFVVHTHYMSHISPSGMNILCGSTAKKTNSKTAFWGQRHMGVPIFHLGQ